MHTSRTSPSEKSRRITKQEATVELERVAMKVWDALRPHVLTNPDGTLPIGPTSYQFWLSIPLSEGRELNASFTIPHGKFLPEEGLK